MKLSKKDLVKQLYTQHHTLARKDLIDLVMKEVKVTENSARTHISNASRELHSTLGKSYLSRNTLKPSLKKEQAKAIVLSNYTQLTRKELAEKLVKDLSLKSLNSAQTHISRIMKELNLK